jgi:hypothetical protein
MSLEMVFNELSLQVPVPDKPSGRRIMTEFVAAVRMAGEIGVPASLRAEAGIHDLLLAPDYPIANGATIRQSIERNNDTFGS